MWMRSVALSGRTLSGDEGAANGKQIKMKFYYSFVILDDKLVAHKIKRGYFGLRSFTQYSTLTHARTTKIKEERICNWIGVIALTWKTMKFIRTSLLSPPQSINPLFSLFFFIFAAKFFVLCFAFSKPCLSHLQLNHPICSLLVKRK